MSFFKVPAGLSRARPPEPTRSEEPLLTAGGFTPDFRSFCGSDGYGKETWMRPLRPAYGGRTTPNQPLERDPVVFIHGTSCTAEQSEAQLKYFLDHGYQPHELYAFSFFGKVPLGANGVMQSVTPRTIRSTQRAIEAVAAYTGRKPVVISHSQGGLWSWAASSGGGFTDRFGELDEVRPLEVKRWIGLAVPYWGVPKALAARLKFRAASVPLLSQMVGLTPDGEQLMRLRAVHPNAEAVYNIASTGDQLLGEGELSVENATAPYGENVRLEGFTHAGLRTEEEVLAMQLAMAKGEWTSDMAPSVPEGIHARNVSRGLVPREERLRDLSGVAEILHGLADEEATLGLRGGQRRSARATLRTAVAVVGRSLAVAGRMSLPAPQQEQLVAQLHAAFLALDTCYRDVRHLPPGALAEAANHVAAAEALCAAATTSERSQLDFEAAPSARIHSDWLAAVQEDAASRRSLRETRFPLQRLLHAFSGPLAFLATGGQGVRVVGAEHLPREGGYILAPNQTRLASDAPVYLNYLMRGQGRYLRPMVLSHGSLINWLATHLGGFPVQRGERANVALAEATELLARGETVALHSERGRRKNDGVGLTEDGPARVALEANVPILPVTVVGNRRVNILQRGKRDVVIHVGPPVSGEGAPASAENVGVLRDRLQRASIDGYQAAKEALDAGGE